MQGRILHGRYLWFCAYVLLEYHEARFLARACALLQCDILNPKTGLNLLNMFSSLWFINDCKSNISHPSWLITRSVSVYSAQSWMLTCAGREQNGFINMLTSTNNDNTFYSYDDMYPRIAFNLRKITTGCFESLMSSNVYISQWTWSSLVKLMAVDSSVTFESQCEAFY